MAWGVQRTVVEWSEEWSVGKGECSAARWSGNGAALCVTKAVSGFPTPSHTPYHYP